MELAILAKAPLVFWIGFAVTLVLPYKLPRFGMVVGAIATAFGAVLCMNDNTDAFARLIAHGLGTAFVVCAGLWLVTACAGAIRVHRAVAEAV